MFGLLDPIGTLRTLLHLFLIPLSFLPASIQLFFSFIIGFFAVFFFGKLLKWLWDLLPIA